MTRAFYGYKKLIISSFVALLFLFLVTSIGTYLYFAKDIKSMELIMNRRDGGVILLDRHGTPFFTLYDAKFKTFVPLSEIPTHMQQAVIASEDQNFYSHQGFSIQGIVRSIFLNAKSSELAYGGSTITQQLVKNSLLRPTKSFMRKYQEIIMASELERRYTKSEILTMYLNSVYFGHGAFGVNEASRVYFNKSAKDLDLAEAITLTSFLPAPSISFNDPQRIRYLQKIALERMLKYNYINQEQFASAINKTVEFKTDSDINSVAPHFAIMVRDELIKKYGEETIASSGFRVVTTLDLDLQRYVEKAVVDQVARLTPDNVSNGAAVVIDPKTSEIRALVGSKNWFDDNYGKFNVALSPRQPGSSFKPIVYSAALEQGIITPATILHDSPVTYAGGYRPVNYDRKFRGNVTVRRALANSLNVPAVEVLSKLGVAPAVDEAKLFGLTTIQDPSQYGLSLTLGAAEVKLLELTNAYAVFANNGYKNTPTAIDRIVDKLGKTIYLHQTDPQQIIKPGTAFLISSILSDSAARAEALGNLLNVSRPAAVKTGTTDDYKDAWTLGYTPSIVVGVWVGNNNNAPMSMIAGSLGAAPIWKQIMEYYFQNTPAEAFVQPSDVVALTICGDNNQPGKTASSSAIREYFIYGTEPTRPCFVSSPTPSVSPSPTQSQTPTPQFTIAPTLAPTVTPTPSPTPQPTIIPSP